MEKNIIGKAPKCVRCKEQLNAYVWRWDGFRAYELCFVCLADQLDKEIKAKKKKV